MTYMTYDLPVTVEEDLGELPEAGQAAVLEDAEGVGARQADEHDVLVEGVRLELHYRVPVQVHGLKVLYADEHVGGQHGQQVVLQVQALQADEAIKCLARQVRQSEAQ